MEQSVLLVDDDKLVRSVIRRILEKHHYTIFEAATCAEAKKTLDSSTPIEIVLLDLNLPDGLGWDLIECVRRRTDRPALIIITGEDSISHAVTALRRGACDFLLKPFNPSQLEDSLARARTEPRMRGSMPLTVRPIDHWRCDNASKLLGNHPSVLKMLEMIRLVSKTSSSILVTGESGTGKELVARAIHTASDRRDHPLIVLNCAAIPENLIESELFGHTKGAFTGATSPRKGLFVAAHMGTIFLDEIGELPMAAQSKLLRVIQEREVLQLGQSVATKIDTRIIAATNIDLEKAVSDGRFREDLYYRLNVINIEVPPLRERKSDIPDLVACFIDRYNKRFGCSVTGLERGLVEHLLGYDWPGNIRELENVLERMIVFHDTGRLEVGDLPKQLLAVGESRLSVGTISIPKEGLVLRRAVESFERSIIEQALDMADGNISATARLIGANRTTLIAKIDRLSIDKDKFEAEPWHEPVQASLPMSKAPREDERHSSRVEVPRTEPLRRSA